VGLPTTNAISVRNIKEGKMPIKKLIKDRLDKIQLNNFMLFGENR